jgi:hypothetical protein
MRTVVVVASVLALVSMSGCKNKNEANCRQALTEATQMANAFRQGLGGGNSAPIQIPDEPFMTQCKALPAGAAQCAVISYNMAHQAECQQYAAQLQGLRQHH